MSLMTAALAVRDQIAEAKKAERESARARQGAQLKEGLLYAFGVEPDLIEFDPKLGQVAAVKDDLRFVVQHGSTPQLHLAVDCPDCGERYVSHRQIHSIANYYGPHYDKPLEERKASALNYVAEVLAYEGREPEYVSGRHVCYRGAAQDLARAAAAHAKRIGCSPEELLSRAKDEVWNLTVVYR